jgi:hypothetical protein
MEPTKNTPNQRPSYQEPPKKVPMYLIALVITLTIVSILLAIKLYTDTRAHSENMLFVETEKGKLETELNGLIVEYDSLKSQNDSLSGQLTAEQDKIRQLLKADASNATKIKMYSRELETLRKVMRSYIVQIDSLNTRNRELTEENIIVRQDLNKVTTDLETVSKEREVLSSTVKIAQKLDAKEIMAEGLNKNSKPTDRVKRITKVRVCFTLRQNNIAMAGKKMIYLRIARPDEVVLASPEAGTFEMDGKSMGYSSKREVEYENVDIDMCIYWDAAEELIEGTYFVNLYSEGYEIGSSSFTIK